MLIDQVIDCSVGKIMIHATSISVALRYTPLVAVALIIAVILKLRGDEYQTAQLRTTDGQAIGFSAAYCAIHPQQKTRYRPTDRLIDRHSLLQTEWRMGSKMSRGSDHRVGHEKERPPTREGDQNRFSA